MRKEIRLAVGLLVLLLVAAAGVHWVRTLPPESSPFARLDLERPIGWATGMQFARIIDDAPACSAALAASELAYEPIKDRRDGAEGQCGFANAVAVTQSSYPYSGAVRVSCPLAAALYVWEREVVTPAAARLESPVARIEMIGAYACRNVYGRETGRLSEHASANAIDVSGFRLENGRLITVAGDWRSEGPDAAFLREVRDGGCGVFRTVLSPDYNQAHADHFHFDMGPYSICR